MARDNATFYRLTYKTLGQSASKHFFVALLHCKERTVVNKFFSKAKSQKRRGCLQCDFVFARCSKIDLHGEDLGCAVLLSCSTSFLH